VHDRLLRERIDAWVIQQVCAQAAAWQAAPAVTLWINLTSARLQGELLARLLPALRQYRLPPGSVGLELNEALLSGPSEQIAPLLQQLQAGGVPVALDDFGSARASLAACQRLQLNTLKIEPSFVQAIGSEGGGSDIIAAVIHLARALSMQVVALGVNHIQQLELLRTLGCDACQGALYAPALPAQGMLDYVQPQAQQAISAQTRRLGLH
jgi:EAL domain-containing protein (putative c-di-GMP-specific phosphodiesterase class I)